MGEQVKSLNEKDQIRKKISIWLGGNSHQAVIHTVKELIGNSNDLIINGNGDTITVIRHNENTITVMDNCKGLPVEGMGTKEIEGVGIVEIPNYQLLTAHLFAGTKYDNGLNGNDQYTVGTNGVFLTVLSRSSEFVKFEVARPNGNIYTFSYAKGDEVEPLTIIGKSDKTYTKITYKLDNDVFIEEDNHFTSLELCEIAEQQASLMKGKIIVIDEEINEVHEYKFTNGIEELLQRYISGKHPINEEIIKFSKRIVKYNDKQKSDDNIIVETVIQYTKEDDNTTQIDFLNGSNLIHHGKIYDGFTAGLRKIFDSYLKDKGMYQKSEKPIRIEDCTTGLNFIINFKSYFPVYANQTKFATDVKYYDEAMREVIEHEFEVFTAENPEIMLKLAQQILINKRSREKSEVNRSKIKKELEGEVGNAITRPPKYVPCRSKDRKKKRLTLIEGDSALNAIKLSRDAEFDSILPLKGKPINCLKKSIDEIVNNTEIKSIVKLLGCGVTYKGKSVKGLSKFNLDDIEFSEINIISDGDEDGFHIRCLLIGMFYVLMQDVIKAQMLKIVEAPLYRVVYKGKEYIAYDEIEKAKILEETNGKGEITRFKGLGGLNTKLSAKTIMSMENRRVKVITMEDVPECIRVLEMFLDDDNNDRKIFIAEHGNEYFDYTMYED